MLTVLVLYSVFSKWSKCWNHYSKTSHLLLQLPWHRPFMFGLYMVCIFTLYFQKKMCQLHHCPACRGANITIAVATFNGYWTSFTYWHHYLGFGFSVECRYCLFCKVTLCATGRVDSLLSFFGVGQQSWLYLHTQHVSSKFIKSERCSDVWWLVSGHCLPIVRNQTSLWYKNCVHKLLTWMHAFHNVVQKQLHQCMSYNTIFPKLIMMLLLHLKKKKNLK